jgi:hypothetical protein
MQTSGKSPGEPSATLIVALRKILRPLVTLLLRNGITLPYLSSFLKEIFVEVAEQEFTLEGRIQTDSRISLLTGVHRKDVRRLRSQPNATPCAPRAVSIGAQVIATWVSDKKYLDKHGVPKRLSVREQGGGKRSFEQLVASVARQDLRPRVVLDELLRLGIVTISDDNFVVLEVDAFVPATGFDEKAYYFGQNVRDHIAAAVHNLDNAEHRFLERAVSYHGLTPNDVAKVEKIANQMEMDGLKEVNRLARGMSRRNKNSDEANRRINFGAYFFSSDAAQDSSTSDPSNRGSDGAHDA